jgi:hypothetical protein
MEQASRRGPKLVNTEDEEVEEKEEDKDKNSNSLTKRHKTAHQL